MPQLQNYSHCPAQDGAGKETTGRGKRGRAGLTCLMTTGERGERLALGQRHCRVRRYGSSPGDRYTCKKERKAFVYSPSALSVWVLSRQPSQNTFFFPVVFFFFYTLSALTAQAAVVLIECFFREVSRERVSCHSGYGSGSAVTVVMEAGQLSQ